MADIRRTRRSAGISLCSRCTALILRLLASFGCTPHVQAQAIFVEPDDPPRRPRSPQAWVPEINIAIPHLRDVLGDQTYESLARKGETMTTAEMVTYTYDEIDEARAEQNDARVSK